MRVYKPQNELGQALLNEGQLVSVAKSITKELSSGVIELTSSDITNIDAWDVSSVRVSIAGTELSFKPEVSKGTGTIKITFTKDRFSDLGFDRATILLSLISSNGVAGGGADAPVEEEMSIEVLISTGIANNDKAMIEKGIDKVIATGDVQQIQAVGSQLAESGIEEYTLAGAKTGAEVMALMIQGSNMGAFENPIATLNGDKLVFNDTNFSYNMMSLENADNESGCAGLFESSNITQFDSELPSLTNGHAMFSGCHSLTPFTIDLPSLTNGEQMFAVCSSLSSFTSELPNLTNGQSMFYNCSSLSSFTSELPNLTNGVAMFGECTNLTFFTPWGKNEDGTLKNSGNTGNLTNCYYMFHNCKLDFDSVKRIADWLPQRGGKPTGSEVSYKDGWIHIGVAQGVNSGTDFDNAISKMTRKNWGVVICVNGFHTTS